VNTLNTLICIIVIIQRVYLDTKNTAERRKLNTIIVW